MLELDSPRWSQLRHAYGAAGDIPDLLRNLEDLPASGGKEEPWFTLWSALAHQGDVYDASFAAVPHVVRVLASAPDRVCFDYFQFPAWVEICRERNGVAVPTDLEPAYRQALATLPALAAAALASSDDDDLLNCALAAISAAKGRPALAELILELYPPMAAECLEWLRTR